MNGVRERTMSGARLPSVFTRKRRSTLRNIESQKDLDGQVEVIEVEYLDGAKEKTSGLTREGTVKAKYSNGDHYQGYVAPTGKDKAFEKSGKGVYTWKSGALYDGRYRNNLKHGRGKYITASGVVFEGLFAGGLKEGKGVYSYEDGSQFYGNWIKGKRSGKGKYLYPDGSTQTGEYQNGKLIDGTKKITLPMKVINGPSILVLGPPCSGKGRQSEQISKEFGVVHVSIDDVVKSAVDDGMDSGMKAQTYTQKGYQVPENLLMELISVRLDKDDVKEKGFVLHGFPSTATQARALVAMGIVFDKVILLDAPKAVVVERLTDETKGASFDERMADYTHGLDALKNYYHVKLTAIDASGSIPDVWPDIQAAVEKK